MPASNRLSFLLSLVLAGLFWFIFGPLVVQSLGKLHLSPQMASFLFVAIILGGLINIPVRRIVQEEPVWSHPLSVFGLDFVMPRWLVRRREMVIAVNVGGCLIPVGIALYQLVFLVPLGEAVILAVALATAVNTLMCYVWATPLPNVGIVMPGFIAPFTAVGTAMALAPLMDLPSGTAPPLAFVAGVLGPLIGADFFHIKAFLKAPVGVASIGGAGTFDGIVLSGIFAAYLTPIY